MSAFSFLFKRDPKVFLGRWKVDHCQMIQNRKVMLANEDHCGTCHYSKIAEQMNRAKKVEEFKQKTDAERRYNEYINAAVKSRRITSTTPDNLEKQIEYYICMN
jgi:formate dehydrogenase assembly factor FdhD